MTIPSPRDVLLSLAADLMQCQIAAANPHTATAYGEACQMASVRADSLAEPPVQSGQPQTRTEGEMAAHGGAVGMMFLAGLGCWITGTYMILGCYVHEKTRGYSSRCDLVCAAAYGLDGAGSLLWRQWALAILLFLAAFFRVFMAWRHWRRRKRVLAALGAKSRARRDAIVRKLRGALKPRPVRRPVPRPVPVPQGGGSW